MTDIIEGLEAMKNAEHMMAYSSAGGPNKNEPLMHSKNYALLDAAISALKAREWVEIDSDVCDLPEDVKTKHVHFAGRNNDEEDFYVIAFGAFWIGGLDSWMCSGGIITGEPITHYKIFELPPAPKCRVYQG